MADEELPAGWEKRLSRSTGTLTRNKDHDFCDSSSLNFVTGNITRPVHSPAFFRRYDQSEGKTLFEIPLNFLVTFVLRIDEFLRTRNDWMLCRGPVSSSLLFRRKTSRHANIYYKKAKNLLYESYLLICRKF